MTTKVIQGYFISGRPPRPAQAEQPKAMPKAMPRVPGPPVPAFSGRPPVAQARGSGDSFQVDPARLGLANGGGRALPDTVREKMEAALGADFSGVRVHVGPQAERIGAVAFTMGSDIYFAPGRFQPDTVHGQQLLGHELAHVVQQRQGRVRNPDGAGIAVVQDRALEAEADRLGHRAASYRPAIQPKMPPGLARRSSARPSEPICGQFNANRLGLQRSTMHAAAHLAPRPGRGWVGNPPGTRTGVVQRASLGGHVVTGIRGLADQLLRLSTAIGVGTPTTLADVLLDPAYDPRGAVAITQEVFESNLGSPLDFASCYPTAEALFPLLSQSVREGGVLFQGANRNTYASGADFRRQVELLIGVMTRGEQSNTPYVFRIEFAGHGFTLVSTLDGEAGDAYQFELIESLAHSAAITDSLIRENRIFAPDAVYQSLRRMADDDVEMRIAGAGAMGWNANALYLGRDAQHAGRIDFPAVRMKWWASKLSRNWRTRWGAQIRDRFNYLAELYGIEDRLPGAS